MNNNRPLGPKDEQAKLDYDVGFTGVDERTHPMELAPGMVARAMNRRFRDKLGSAKCATRLGCPIMPWLKGSDGRTPFSQVYGAMVFSDPNGVEWFIIAADNGIWRTRPGMSAVAVPLPASVALTAANFAQLVQCFNTIILLRGPDYPPLACTDLDAGFKSVVQSQAAIEAGLRSMPNSSFGIAALNRLLLVQGKDNCACSDTLDYTGYIPVTETFRINQGDADQLVAMATFGQSQIVMLKSQSIYLVQNATGDLTGATLTELTREYGCVAPLSVAVQGNTLYWVDGEGRVSSLQLTELNQTQTSDQHLSDLMPLTLGRINPLYLSGCVSAIWDGRLYVGVPLDDAQMEQANIMVGAPVSIGGQVTMPAVVGRLYSFQVNGDTGFTSLTNGNTTLTEDGTFTAQTTSVTFNGTWPDSTEVVMELYPVLTGINTGVMVYDFQTSAWCGTDEGAAVCPVAFVKATFNGAKRLFMVCADGCLRLYEEGFTDDVMQTVATPYVDILVNTLPSGSTFTWGFGTSFPPGTQHIHSANSATNSGVNWGCDNLADAQENLYLGFSSGGWHLQGATPTQILGGVRLSGGPTVMNIDGIVVSKSGFATWAYVDVHTGLEVTSVPIESSYTTRGYVTRQYIFANDDRKRFLMIAALMNTWDPNYTLNVMVNGVNQTTDYADGQTRSNTAYDVFGQADWNPSNVNNDHGTPKRQDYSVALPDSGFNLGSGVNFELQQTMTDRKPIDEKGHYVQLQFTNTSGRDELVGVFMEAQEGEKLSGQSI